MGYYFKIKAKYIFLVLPVLLGLFFIQDFIQYVTVLSGAFFLYRLISFLDRFGKEVLFLDIIELLIIVQWVFAPALYYCLKEYDLIFWKRFYWVMRVPAEEYFALAIPSSAATLFGMRLFVSKVKFNIPALLESISKRQHENAKIGLTLISISVFTGLFSSVIPSGLQYVSTLFSNFFFIGFLYLYYSNIKQKRLIIILLIMYVVVKGLIGGMFGDIIWWPLFILMITFLGKKVSLNLKLTIVTVGFICFSVLQSVKSTYRNITWLGRGNVSKEASRIDILNSLVVDKLSNEKESIFSMESFFPIISRLNQGLHVTNAMVYTPTKEPYAYGETIGTAVAAAFVPRLLWPDKPEAGGKANYKRFTGFVLKSASMNIGQIGDAYVNFTTFGAPFFLLVYGVLLSLLFKTCINLINTYPRLIFWLPFLFIGLITVESDFLTTFNALLKSVIFLIIVFKLKKTIFT